MANWLQSQGSVNSVDTGDGAHNGRNAETPNTQDTTEAVDNGDNQAIGHTAEGPLVLDGAARAGEALETCGCV